MPKDLQEFLSQYPGFNGCTIETHDDNKERKDPALTRIFSELNLEKLNRLNQLGAAIYFSVNPMIKGERRQEAVTGIVTWACESDDMPKQDQRTLIEQSPIKPSCIIESKNSLHLYWFSLNGTIEKWKEIGGLLMRFFKGDPKVCLDHGGLLRLPGFLHMKQADDPFMVKLVYIDPALQYTEQQMIDGFSKIVGEIVEVQPYTKRYNPEEHGLRGHLSTRNNEEMLKSLSGKPIINGDIISFKKNTDGTRQIFVNKKSTGCRIDKDGMIGSHDKGGPTWIQRVLWYKKLSKRQLLQYVKDNFSSRVPSEYTQQLEKTNYLTDKGKIIAVEFARYLKESENVEGIDGNLFKYFPDEGMWKGLNDYEMDQTIIREAKEFLEQDISTKLELESILKFIKVHAENKIIKEKLQQVSQHEINIDDCIIDTTDWSTRAYTKDDYKISKLPYNSADIANYEQHKPTRWLQFLEEIFASYENVDEILSFRQEVIGHFLLPLTKRGKMFILQGGGRNGKGKFIGAIRYMLGENNCCDVELHKTEDVDREKLLGKLLAIDSDTSDNIRLDIGPIRKIADGESLEARLRYGHPFSFKPFARMLLAANDPPTINKMDSNMRRRIVYCPFRENFQYRADTELGAKLEKESLGIFIWGLQGLKRLLERNGFDIPAEILYETEQYLSKFKSVATQDVVGEFLGYTGLTPGPESLCKHVVYSAYETFCKQKGLRKYLGKQQLTRVLWNKGFDDKNSTDCRGIGVVTSSLNMTFLDEVMDEKSYDDDS